GDTKDAIGNECGLAACDEPRDTAEVSSSPVAGMIVSAAFVDDATGSATGTSGSTAIARGRTRIAAIATVNIAWRIAARVWRARRAAANARARITVAFAASRRTLITLGDRCRMLGATTVACQEAVD